MQLWCDVYDPTYTERVGNRLRPIRASYKRKLDEAGSGRATFAVDPRALAQLDVRHIVEVWLSSVRLEWDASTTSWNKAPYQRMLGAFVMEEVSPNKTSRTITVRGPGVMSKLVDTITLPGLSYQNQSVRDVLDDLAALAGWTVNADSSLSNQNISVRFAGENVLRAMRFVCEAQGVHLRESSSGLTTVDAGPFGAVQGMAEYAPGDTGEMALRRDTPYVIAGANITEQSSDVVNKVYAYGGGDGDAALTMELAASSRGFVDSEFANDRLHYFVENSASRFLYGSIARRLDIKRINPTDASDAAVLNASKAVADAAQVWLERHSSPYERLKLQLQNVDDRIDVGDKLRVRYQDVINLLGVPYQETNIDEDYFVMSVEETASAESLETAVEVANVDRYEQGAAEIVVGMVDSIQVQNINIQPYPAPYTFPAPKAPIDTNTGYAARFIVNSQTVRLNSAKAYIFRSSWTAIASSAAAGGSDVDINIPAHRHKMLDWNSTSGTAYGGVASAWNDFSYWTGSGFGSGFFGTFVSQDIYTYEAAGSSTLALPDHTHPAEFTEVSVDNQLPEDVTLTIDGTTVETGLFPSGNSDDFVEVDITDALTGDVRGVHSVGVECAAGRGDIYVVFFIDVDISRVRVD